MALDRVTFQVAEGEVFGLLGPNGAGKTTLVRILCTLVEPTSGRASILGHDLAEGQAIRRLVSLTSGEDRSFYWRLSGRENLRFFAALHGLSRREADQRIEELNALLGLTEALEERFDRLSTGLRRRLDLARALLHDPAVLFLDEPTRSLDPAATANVHGLLRRLAESGKTLFLVTHRLEEAEALCNRVAILHGGRLRAVAPVSELRRTVARERRYRLRLAGAIAGNTEPWKDWPWPVREVDACDGLCLELELGCDEPLEEVVERVRASGLRLLDADLEERSLEEAFAFYTRTDAETSPPMLSTVLPVSPSAGRELGLPCHPSAPAGRPAVFSPTALGRRLAAFLRRELLLQLSYRLATWLQLGGILFSVAAFYFLAQFLGGAASPLLAEYGGNYFAFVLIGIAYTAYQSAGLFSFSEAIRNGQIQGTLEAILLTPTPVSLMLLASALWSFILASLQVMLYLLVGVLLFGAALGQVHLGTAVLTLFLSIVAFAGLGILSASIILVTKRGDPISLALAAASALLSGVYYPVALLPRALRALAFLLPMTHALRAMRLALLQGATPLHVAPELAYLALFGLVLFPGGLLTFQLALRRARRDGTLGQY